VSPKAKAPKTPPTPAQLEKAFLTPCKTEKELQNFIKFFFGLHLPDCRVSRYADTDPFHAVWQVYDICVNKRNPLAVQELLYVAGRGSGKTLGMAIAELLILLHDRRDVVHVGSIMSQAKRCYEYQTKFLLSDRIKPIVSPPKTLEEDCILQKNNMERSVFKLGSEKVSLEVLPCTLKSVNGPHVPLVVVDEIDTVSGEGLKAFKDISGMIDSRSGKVALRVGISTRKTRYGLMNQQIENADREGRTVRRWTVFEFTQRCDDDRSGVVPTKLYVQQDEMRVITENEWKTIDSTKQNEFIPYEMYDKCARCPIAAICLGDAKNQKSTSPMLKPIEDAVKKTIEGGPDWALSQLMNLKPSIEGIIYREYDERVHVKQWNEMWKILTGVDYPGECTHDMFVKKCHDMKLACYAGVDWGWSNPSTLVVFFVDGRENVYVVRCDGRTYYSNPNWIQYIKNKWHNVYRVHLYFPDLANPGDGEEMRKAGLPVPSKIDKNIMDGIQIVKKWLRSFGSPVPKIFFAKETCGPIMDEFTMFHYKTDAAGNITDDPDDEFDHWLDALRYPMFGLFGKTPVILGSGSLSDDSANVVDGEGRYMRPPSAAEFAAAQGIILNPNQEVDVSKLGKIEHSKNLDDDEGEVAGSAGFLWSFALAFLMLPMLGNLL
jgi:hypothetical protein